MKALLTFLGIHDALVKLPDALSNILLVKKKRIHLNRFALPQKIEPFARKQTKQVTGSNGLTRRGGLKAKWQRNYK